jgi:hypothetical protein
MTSENEGNGRACMTVDAGVCRFHTRIVATSVDGNIRYQIESDCPHVSKLPTVLKDDMSPFDALKMPFIENPVYEICGKVLIHSACPVPSALIKCAEVASGLGLKRAVKFEFDC